MADKTKIEWADATLNYVSGCSVVSPGCTNCYAMRAGGRNLPGHPSTGLTKPTKAGHVWTGEVRANDKALMQALAWKRPRRIFWNAHGDLFHENVPDAWIDRQFAVMALTPQHIHMVLTKRPERMREYCISRFGGWGEPHLADAIEAINGFKKDGGGEWGEPLPNVWLGTSVEDQTRADERIPHLLATPAAVRFLSCEPLLGPVDLTMLDARPSEAGEQESSGLRWVDALTGDYADGEGHIGDIWCHDRPGIDWVIVGGESGPDARPMHPGWVRSLRDQCAEANVPFHFKQWGEWMPVTYFDGIGETYDYRFDDGSGRTVGEVSRRAVIKNYHDHDFARIGKRRAGRMLDGVTHDGVPA